MNIEKTSVALSIVSFIAIAATANGSQDSLGPNGINALGLKTFTGQPLNGQGQDIGMVEPGRPGRPPMDDFQHSNATIVPAGVFLENGASAPNAPEIDNHSEWVAGVMISTDPIYTGVAPGANLYASAYFGDVDSSTQSAVSAQHVATRGLGFVSAINHSYIVILPADVPDGNSLHTLFVDWLASRYDVLNIQGGRNVSSVADQFSATDSFNGITVQSLEKNIIGEYSLVSTQNDYSQNSYSIFNRTFTQLLAPGDPVDLTGLGGLPTQQTGNSYAAPHVTGTVALLQQYGDERFSAADPKFPNEFRRHEVMKAVLLNSANKIKDDGTRTVNGISVPAGGFLGMNKTITDPLNSDRDWLQSEAFLDNTTDGLTPLDEHMGAGALDAKRALMQFSAGQYHNDLAPAQVPAIGWDYQGQPGLEQARKYQFTQSLVGGSFVSITLAYDRTVTFDTDNGSPNFYDVGDTFNSSSTFVPGQDQRNDLDLYLLPKGATSIDDAIALSGSSDSTIEHLFAQIPTTGEYEFWVYQFDNNLGGSSEHYGVAWWADFASTGTSMGDYNGDQVVDAQDYNVWRGGLGNDVTPGTGADGNGNGKIDAADYVVWRNSLTAGTGTSLASVPEPMGLMPLVCAGAMLFNRRRCSSSS